MNLIRTFIAIELPVDLLLMLAKLQRTLNDAPGGRAVNWVRKEGIHLTLKFLGDVHQDALPLIYTGIEQACAKQTPFAVQVGGLGCFPNISRPRVVWVGLKDEQQQLQRIEQALENELAAHGYKREDRAFQPHLTLGRVRSSAFSPEVEILGRTVASYPEVNLGQIQVDYLCAISSTLSPSGAIYRILYQSPLAGARVASGDVAKDVSPLPPSE
jgi:RNA 2',3'-cyclic 3'-phosphodiesterase